MMETPLTQMAELLTELQLKLAGYALVDPQALLIHALFAQLVFTKMIPQIQSTVFLNVEMV